MPLTQHGIQFTLDRWTGTYCIPRDLSDPRGLQTRLDEMVADRLPLACESILEHYIDGSDPSVWRIRNLSLNLSIDAAFSDVQCIAHDLGSSLVSEILSIFENNETSDSVLRFPNRAAYLAQFISDLAAGRAWEKWYYEEFSGLRFLLDRQVICSIFMSGEVSAPDLLLELASVGGLGSVLQLVSEEDAHLIFQLCFAGSTTSRGHTLQGLAGAVLEAWTTAPLQIDFSSGGRFCDALRLLARTLASSPSLLDPGLKTVIETLLGLRQVLQKISKPSIVDSLFQCLSISDLQSAREIAATNGAQDGAESLGHFAEMMQGDQMWAHHAAGVVLGDWNKKRYLTCSNLQESEPILSRFGAVFLLGPSFAALSLETAAEIASATTSCAGNTAALLRHLAAVKCFGQTRFPEACDDPALRLFSGLEQLSFRQALKELRGLQLNLDGAQQVLLAALNKNHAWHQPVLLADLVSAGGEQPILVVHELTRDEWLDARPIGLHAGDTIRALQASLEYLGTTWNLEGCEIYLGRTIADEELTDCVRQSFRKHCSVLPLDRAAEEELACKLNLAPSQLSYRLASARRQFPYFSLAAGCLDFELDARLDCVFTLVARAALHHFSRKLFGFESSSPAYLYENFFAGLSEIRLNGERLEIRLPESPLSLIFRMAGIQDEQYKLAWHKGLEVWLLGRPQ